MASDNTNNIYFDETNFQDDVNLELIGKGKVRDIYNFKNSNNEYLVFNTTDRCSAFDYNVCQIDMKGYYLTQIAAYWFKTLSHIVNNHYITHNNNCLLVRKCSPIKLEFIVRGYITGSCWKAYSRGERFISGVDLPDHLRENQKFSNPILTPTTKGEHDYPISKEEIIRKKIVTSSQLDFIYQKCFELFEEGTRISAQKGLILVDTKYEFGIDDEGEICLIDEFHTPDSSRFWIKKTYDSQISINPVFSRLKPQSLDKDAVRNYLDGINFKTDINNFLNNGGNLDDFNMPVIPDEVKNRIKTTYYSVSQLFSLNNNGTLMINNIVVPSSLCNEEYTTFNSNFNLNSIEMKHFANHMVDHEQPIVFILAGSTTDSEHTNKIMNALKGVGINAVCSYISAHKNTLTAVKVIDGVNTLFKKVVWITVAGRSNALSGVVAANTHFPVLACPPFKDKVDMMVNINSTLQMPSKTPVMTVIDVNNTVMCCKRIFDMIR